MFSIFKFKKKEESVKELKAFVTGKIIPIEEVNDMAFSSKALGDGLAILPESEVILAPCDGIISVVMKDSKHAVGIKLNNGAEILIHEGLETVNMQGEGFELFVEEGKIVKTGDKLLKFSPSLIKEKGYETVCILVVTNADEFPNLKLMTGIEAQQKKTVIAEFN